MIDLLAGARWVLGRADAGSIEDPADLTEISTWIDAVVPGTVASCVGGDLDPDAYDWWYATEIDTGSAEGPLVLTFDGIATRARIWVDGTHRATVTSMFAPQTLELIEYGSTVRVHVHVESLAAALKARRPRGRWRSSLVAAQGLRHERTTLLGRAPVYGPLPVPVGLWRPVTMVPRPQVRVTALSATMDSGSPTLRLRAEIDGAPDRARILLGDSVFEVDCSSVLDVAVAVPTARPWRPHTHGEPQTYPVALEMDGVRHDVGVVGFRTVQFDRTDGDATLVVNGERIFCRGGTWTPLDPIGLVSSESQVRTALEQLRSAGLNMVRVVGTMVYEQPEFYSLCAELGIMVWQDIMFGTTDPPTDDGFTESVERELAAFGETVAGNPALVVVSGGSETQQQPTMLGLSDVDQRMAMLEDVIPAFLDRALPEVAYVTSSPSSVSGELHTHVGDGVAHYFGVGGYLRPLSDVRTAGVRFAAECLAFAVPPERAAVERFFGSANVAGHHPDWKAAVPRDRGSSWDFEDVRDHYVRSVFGVDPHEIRRDDAELYLDYGRAALVEAFTAAYEHWRRPASRCGGALVLTLRDTVPGAGWGITDSTGAKKAPWYALARASAPVAVLLTDAGLDGYLVDVVNDGAELAGSIDVVLHTASGSRDHSTAVCVPARGALSLSVDSIIGTFTDANHAYRFGAQTYSAITVILRGEDGTETARTTKLVGPQPRQNTVGLSTSVLESADGTWRLTVESQWPAYHVCVDVDGFEVSDSWFHLAPHEPRTITLSGPPAKKPRGHVRALNAAARVTIIP